MDGIRFVVCLFYVVLLLILPIAWIISLAWIHYPQGIIKMIKEKKLKRKKGK